LRVTTDAAIQMPLPGGLLAAQATFLLILAVCALAVIACAAITLVSRAAGERLPARALGVAAQFAVAVWAGNGVLALSGAPGWLFTALDVAAVGVAVLTGVFLAISWRGARGAGVPAQVTGAPQTGNQRSSSPSIGSSRPSAA
jgi:hypothetical protein